MGSKSDLPKYISFYFISFTEKVIHHRNKKEMEDIYFFIF